jgi:UDP-GlcNAc3NAcA epimerase
LAGALVAAKLHIPVAHIEAGVRSYNKKMPEEINRILTDHVSTYYFIPTEDAKQNLSKEGITENIFNFGDIMKDVLDYVVGNNFLTKNDINSQPYYYATIHRPYNTDDKEKLEKLLNTLNNLDLKVVFAIHPRTEGKMENYGFLKEDYSNIIFINPQAYITNLCYIKHSEAVITDSGGIQKEAYWLKTRCITIRSETEWTETLQHGWNQLCFDNLESLNMYLHNPLGTYVPLYSEGNTGQKIIQLLVDKL